jgi:hypothetical protein
MTLQKFRALAFPFPQQSDNLTGAVFPTIPLQQAKAVGGDPAHPSSLVTAASRRENNWYSTGR